MSNRAKRRRGGVASTTPWPGAGKPQSLLQRSRYSTDFPQAGLIAPQAETGGYNVTSGVNPAGSSVTCAKPVNTSDLDVLVACLFGSNTSSVWTPPSGWTQVFEFNSTRNNALYTKPIPSAAAETDTSYTWSASGGSGRLHCLIFRLTGGPQTGITDAVGSQGTTTQSTISAPSLNTNAERTLLLGMWSASHTADVMDLAPPAGMVEIGQNVTNPISTSTLMIAAETLNSAGATGTRGATVTPSSNSSVSGVLVAFSPGDLVTQDLVEGWGTRIF